MVDMRSKLLVNSQSIIKFLFIFLDCRRADYFSEDVTNSQPSILGINPECIYFPSEQQQHTEWGQMARFFFLTQSL